MPTVFLRKWFAELIGPRKAVHQITFYTRQGCTCCDKALLELEKSNRRFHFNIQKVDIDSDPYLVEKFGLEVPVIAIDGKLRFKGLINPVLLERILKQP